MGSARSSCSIVAWSNVDNQHFVLYVPNVGYCVCCDISAGLKKPADLYGTCYMSLFFDMCFSTSLNPLLQCPIMTYNLQAVCMQSAPARNVIILWGHSIGHSKQQTVYVHVSYCERFLRKSSFIVQQFGFGAQNCPSLTPYCALLIFVHGVAWRVKCTEQKWIPKTNCSIS